MIELINEAAEACNAGRLRESEALLRRVLNEEPAHAMALDLMGELRIREKRYDEAIEYCEAAVRNGARRPETYDNLGALYHIMGDLDRAIEWFDASIGVQLQFQPAHKHLDAMLAAQGRANDRFLVSVITPTLGNDVLRQALESVQNQTYANIEHLVVADGPQAEASVIALIGETEGVHPVNQITLPYNTGADRYNGHLIYGAALFLVKGRYVCYLDEDNSFDPDHIASLMACITSRGLQWAYSLRKIIDQNGALLGQDDCQSLGRWPTWNRPDLNLVDTNCYMVRRDVALEQGNLWHHRTGYFHGPDFRICRALIDNYPAFDCSRKYSVNYMVESSETSVNAEYFAMGNAEMAKRYPDGYPWAALAD